MTRKEHFTAVAKEMAGWKRKHTIEALQAWAIADATVVEGVRVSLADPRYNALVDIMHRRGKRSREILRTLAEVEGEPSYEVLRAALMKYRAHRAHYDSMEV